MVTKTSGKYTAEFIVSEANGYRSRRTGTLSEGETVVAGEVLQFDSAGDLVPFDGTVDTAGVDEAAGIAFDNYDSTDGALGGVVYIGGDAEVNLGELTFPSGSEEAVIASLAKIGIICRENPPLSPET